MATNLRSRRSRLARRTTHNAAAAAGAACAALLLLLLLPDDLVTSQRASILLAYASLGFLFLTLTIGPCNVLLGRRNPVSADLRRDLGIWAGITGVGHIVFAFQHHLGGNILKYFFTYGKIAPRGLRRDAFGVANNIGLLATLILVLLVAISNDRAHRRLGRRWKTVQRANYVLGALAVLHTVIFWDVLDRTRRIALPIAAAAIAVVVLQLLGVARHRQKRVGAPAT